MNNFTKTEVLPKTGHVNEVCKEWLVREDSALAYKLQSQEINDFYKGNRQRNAVVREDFPTALHEQIKEKEQAEKQVEHYRRRLLEQEEHDKCVAKEIADKLERDLQEQRQRELLESEEVAQQMQELYVNLPTPSRGKSHPPPPRPAKASILQPHSNEPSTSNGRYYSSSHQHSNHQPQQQLSQSPQTLQQQPFNHPYQQQSPATFMLQQKHFSQTDWYVGLTVQNPTSPKATTPSDYTVDSSPPPISSSSSRQQSISQSKIQSKVSNSTSTTSGHLLVSVCERPVTNKFVDVPHVGRNSHALTNLTNSCNLLHQHQHSMPSTSTDSAVLATPSTAAGAAVAAPVPTPSFAHQHNTNHSPTTQSNAIESHPTHSPFTNHLQMATHQSKQRHRHLHQRQHSVEELVEYSDVVDSIRHIDIGAGGAGGIDDGAADLPLNNTSSIDISNPSTALNNRLHSASNDNLLKNEYKFQKLSPEKYDQLVGNDGAVAGGSGALAVERHMQAHADDIELYVDPCDYASLKEIGLPMEEIKEMSKKLKQEQKDELLARRLQQMEANDGLTQEERDRLLAIEAQDKELAKMLQERERAKAKRAKEKARLRKHQQRDGVAGGTTLCSNGSLNGLHCGPLLPLPQDCLSFAKSTAHAPPPVTSATSAFTGHPSAQSSILEEENIIDVEAYSNPIDVLHNQQQRHHHNGTLTNGSLTRDSRRSSNSQHNSNGSMINRGDEDIYTLPVDNCRPGQRPTSLNISPAVEANGGDLMQHISMTRSENYAVGLNDSLSRHDLTPRMNYSQSGTFDKSSSPTPPYMPIQGTRRSNSSDDRKKKSKDKCTHQ